MHVPVVSHAHRKLRRLERYVPASEIEQKAQAVVGQLPIDTGTIVGCYRNDGDLPTDWIVFTTDGVSANFDGVWKHIRYSEINRVVRSEVNDVDADEVCLELRSMNHATMLVNGKNTERGTHDKYMVMMFLESVIGTEGSSN